VDPHAEAEGRMKAILERLPSGLRINGVAVAVALVLGWAAFLLLSELSGTLGAAFAPSASSAVEEPFREALADHATLIETSRKRFEGRSMFYPPAAPRAPRKPPPPAPIEPVEPPPPPPPPPPPAVYGGPKPRGVLGDIVFFENDTRIRKGESAGGVTVLGIESPYVVRLAHARGEYSVSVWGDRNDRMFKTNPFPKSSLPGIVTAPEDGASGRPGGDGAMGGPAGLGRGTPTGGGAAVPGGSLGSDGGPAGVAGGAGSSGGSGGADQPAGAPVPVPATTPANHPHADPNTNPPTEEPTSTAAGVEYYPRERLPDPITEAQVVAMDVREARARLRAVEVSLEIPNLDGHSRARLEAEGQWLRDRVSRES